MFKIQTQRVFLDVYLSDGSNIRLYPDIRHCRKNIRGNGFLELCWKFPFVKSGQKLIQFQLGKDKPLYMKTYKSILCGLWGVYCPRGLGDIAGSADEILGP